MVLQEEEHSMDARCYFFLQDFVQTPSSVFFRVLKSSVVAEYPSSNVKDRTDIFFSPRRWWNHMRSSCWNASAVLVLLGRIASHRHAGLASDPGQLLCKQALPLSGPSPKACSSPAFEKHCSDPREVLTLQCTHFTISLGKAPVFSWSPVERADFQ